MFELPQPPEYIRSLKPYVPGKPIEETQREYGLKRVVKLASNENPFGPSPRAVAAARKSLKESHRYPDSAAYSLRKALSTHLSTAHRTVAPNELLLGNGSNELIDLLIRTYSVSGDAIATSQAAFVAYRVCAQAHGVRVLEAPLTEDMRFDLGAILDSVRRDSRVKLVFIANPNNPTGTHNTSLEIREFLESLAKIRRGSVICVLDYAYWEYVSSHRGKEAIPDPLVLQLEFPNVVVLRTFSKVYGLAGFRMGYAIGSAALLSYCERIRMPFNLATPSMAAAEAALADKAHVRRAVSENKRAMIFWQKELSRLSIPYWPSQGNFLLVNTRVGMGMSGPEVFEKSLKLGVIFRPVANYGLDDALRISMGTMLENRIAVRALERLKG
ncbi:MAG: histidinol-phosphate transaminase [Bdellovibrionales bacterium]|nr:histidinol-phosphate transaminase [Bdellovibrionales bacterium]